MLERIPSRTTRERIELRPGETVAALAAPGAVIAVAGLVP
jgi:hypothetical protein